VVRLMGSRSTGQTDLHIPVKALIAHKSKRPGSR
jgi:hypothetical protein